MCVSVFLSVTLVFVSLTKVGVRPPKVINLLHFGAKLLGLIGDLIKNSVDHDDQTKFLVLSNDFDHR